MLTIIRSPPLVPRRYSGKTSSLFHFRLFFLGILLYRLWLFAGQWQSHCAPTSIVETTDLQTDARLHHLYLLVQRLESVRLLTLRGISQSISSEPVRGPRSYSRGPCVRMDDWCKAPMEQMWPLDGKRHAIECLPIGKPHMMDVD